jgi:hypothetical protein
VDDPDVRRQLAYMRGGSLIILGILAIAALIVIGLIPYRVLGLPVCPAPWQVITFQSGTLSSGCRNYDGWRIAAMAILAVGGVASISGGERVISHYRTPAPLPAPTAQLHRGYLFESRKDAEGARTASWAQPATSVPPPPPPAGWYPMQGQTGWLRYWDGTQWTDQTSSNEPPRA